MGNDIGRQCPSLFAGWEQVATSQPSAATPDKPKDNPLANDAKKAKKKKKKKKKKKSKVDREKSEVGGSVGGLNAEALAALGESKDANKMERLSAYGAPRKEKKSIHPFRVKGPHFGVPLDKVPMSNDRNLLKLYRVPVPRVLVFMKHYMWSTGAHMREGVFRISPTVSDLEETKQQLDNGTFKKAKSINTMPTLIKKWFKELPTPILDSVPHLKMLETRDDEKQIGRIIGTMPEAEKAVMLWLLDLMVDTSNVEVKNKMTARNLAVVFAPNLYRQPQPDELDAKDPMVVLQFANHASRWVMKAVQWRRSKRPAHLDSMTFMMDEEDSPSVSSSPDVAEQRKTAKRRAAKQKAMAT